MIATRMASALDVESVVWYRDSKVVRVIRSEYAKEREWQCGRGVNE